MVKRTKATEAMLNSTSRTVGTKDLAYKRMAPEALKAVIIREKWVYVRFPYFVKFKSGFPKGTVVKKTAMHNVYRINAVKLLDFLFKIGYSKYSSDDVLKATEEFNKSLDKLINGMEV